MPDEYEAPAGQIWVCDACGKYDRNRMAFEDESCFLNAVLCFDSASQEWEAVPKRGCQEMSEFKSYSQNGEDKLILPYFAEGYEGSVLEIGAWFPEEFSNSRALIERGWSAVLVELSPLPLDRLVRAYAGNPKVKVISAAVTPCDQHVQEFQITEDALSSAAPGTVARWKGMRADYDGGFYGALWVPTLPISRIFEQFYGKKHPDVVSIDVEGGSVPLCIEMLHLGPRPKIIIVEHDNRMVEMAEVAEPAGYVTRNITQENMVLVRQ